MNKLLGLVKSPKLPVYSDGNWDDIEEELGLWFPKDYVEIVSKYGLGRFGEFLELFNPFCENPAFNLLDKIDEVAQQFEYYKAKSPKLYPFPLFPDPNCLLPWGRSEADHLFFWHCTDDENPDSWPIVVYSSNGKHEVFNMTTSAFLTKFLSGKLDSDILPIDIEPVFDAYLLDAGNAE